MANLVLTESTIATRGETTTSYGNRCCTKARAVALGCTVTAPSGATDSLLITGAKGNLPKLAVSMAGFTYGGTATSPSVSGNTGNGTVTYTYKASGASSYSSTKPVAVGTHTVKASVAATTNYIAKDVTSTYTVSKAAGSASVSGVSLTFNNSSRNLVTVSGNTGTMHYRVGTSGSWTTTIPTSTNVGSWTIYYYMDASTNYTARGSSSSPWGSVSSSIGKANQSAPTATGKTTTYPTTATATASGGGGVGTLTWTNGNSLTSVGSKKTKAYWAGNGNYNASPYSNEVTVQMNKASGSVSTAPTAKNPGYTGSPVALVNAGSGTGTMYYSLNSSSGFSTSIPTATNVGSYTVYYYAAASTNYNLSSTGSVTSTISYVEGFAPTTYSLSKTITKTPYSGGTSFSVTIPAIFVYYSKTYPLNANLTIKGMSFVTFLSGTNVLGASNFSFNGMSLPMNNYQGQAGSLYKFVNYSGSGWLVHVDNQTKLTKGTGVYRTPVVCNGYTCYLDISITVK